jgi:hypothetical protein
MESPVIFKASKSEVYVKCDIPPVQHFVLEYSLRSAKTEHTEKMISQISQKSSVSEFLCILQDYIAIFLLLVQ